MIIRLTGLVNSIKPLQLYYLAESLKNEQNRTFELLSCPSNTRGFINPNLLVKRIQAYENAQVSPPVLEQVLCILRLDVESIQDEDRRVIAKELLLLDNEFSHACAYALGGNVTFGNKAPLWVAASSIRNQAEGDVNLIKHFGELGPDAGKPAQYRIWVEDRGSENFKFYELRVDVKPEPPEKIQLENLTTLFHQEPQSEFNFYNFSRFLDSKGLVKWGSTIWPSNLEPYFCCGATEIDISWAEAQWHVQSFFEPLFDSNVPLKPMAILLIVAGISSKETGQRGTAIEILIQAIEDGRYNNDDIADVMVRLITSGIIIVSRWTKVFQELATIFKKHEEVVRKLLQSILTFHPDKSPRELGGLIELLYELCIAAGQPPSEPCAIKFFNENTKGGKQKTFSKKLLKMLD